jgi:hypothetical protein
VALRATHVAAVAKVTRIPAYDGALKAPRFLNRFLRRRQLPIQCRRLVRITKAYGSPVP